MDGLGLTLVYGLLAGAGWLAYVAVKSARRRAVDDGTRPRRHRHGFCRDVEIAGQTFRVKGEQEVTALSTWHIEVTGPLPRGLLIEPGGGRAERDPIEVFDAIQGIGSWRVAGAPELVASLMDKDTRARLGALESLFALRDGKLMADVVITDAKGLHEVPADAVSLAKLLVGARSDFARLVAATRDDDATVRGLALDALRAAHPSNTATAEAIQKAERDADARVRVRAQLATGRADAALSELEKAGAKSDGRLQLSLHALLRARLGGERLAPIWRVALDARWATIPLKVWLVDAVGRRDAAVVAALGGAEAAEVRLCELLAGDAPWEVRKAAVGALERVGTAYCIPKLRAVQSRNGRLLEEEVLARIQARLGKGGELMLVDNASVGALSEVEGSR